MRITDYPGRSLLRNIRKPRRLQTRSAKLIGYGIILSAVHSVNGLPTPRPTPLITNGGFDSPVQSYHIKQEDDDGCYSSRPTPPPIFLHSEAKRQRPNTN